MKIEVEDATGAVLDWLVAKCEGVVLEHGLTDDERYSTNPAQGHPIIERERISVRTCASPGHQWVAFLDFGGSYVSGIKARMTGPTALIAAMRCYVTCKLGHVVDVPDELCNKEV